MSLPKRGYQMLSNCLELGLRRNIKKLIRKNLFTQYFHLNYNSLYSLTLVNDYSIFKCKKKGRKKKRKKKRKENLE